MQRVVGEIALSPHSLDCRPLSSRCRPSLLLPHQPTPLAAARLPAVLLFPISDVELSFPVAMRKK